MFQIPDYQRITDGTNIMTVGLLDTTGIGINTVNLGVYRATPPTLTDGQVYPPRITKSGKLAIEATVSDNESPTKYQLRTDFDAVGDILNTSTDVVLLAVTTTSGVLDFIAVSGGNANYEIAIEIDGTERLRITMAELASIGLGNATNVATWAETANKNFRYHPKDPVGFTTGFRILAKATGAPLPTVTHMTLYRERVSS